MYFPATGLHTLLSAHSPSPHYKGQDFPAESRISQLQAAGSSCRAPVDGNVDLSVLEQRSPLGPSRALGDACLQMLPEPPGAWISSCLTGQKSHFSRRMCQTPMYGQRCGKRRKRKATGASFLKEKYIQTPSGIVESQNGPHRAGH